MFRYGPASNSKWLLWGHDIYGVLSGEVCAISTFPQILGRTMEYCAKMNQDLGLTCVLPDFFRGVDGRPDPVPSWDQLGFSLFLFAFSSSPAILVYVAMMVRWNCGVISG